MAFGIRIMLFVDETPIISDTLRIVLYIYWCVLAEYCANWTVLVDQAAPVCRGGFNVDYTLNIDSTLNFIQP